METAPNTYLDLFFAYAAIWFIIALYVFRLQREQRRLCKELEHIKSALSKSGQDKQH